MGQEIIGVCGSGELARSLTNLGLTVIGAPDFRQAVAALREAQATHGTFPVIVVDAEPSSGIRPWVESQSRRTDVRIIPGPGNVLAGHDLAVELPLPVGDLLAGLGLPSPLTDEADLLIHHGGVIGGAQQSMSPAPQQPTPVASQHAAMPTPSQQHTQVPAETQPPENLAAQREATALTSQTQPAAMPAQAPQTPTLDGASSSRNVPTALPQGAVESGHSSEPDWLLGLLREQNPEPVQVLQPIQRQQPAQPPYQPQAPMHPQPVQQPFEQFTAQPMQQPAQQTHPSTQQWPGAMSAGDYFDSRNQAMQNHHAAQVAGNCLIIGARKGGVGKTSSSLMCAETAGAAGLRVVLVDLNRGQANGRIYLKIDGQPFPTIHDAKSRGWQAAIVPAEHITQARGARGAVHFDLVQGPPEHLASPEDTPAALYESVIRELRGVYDLVVIDTQIAEAHFTDLWDEVVVPELRSGAWFLGLFDKSPSGMPDLRGLTEKFVTQYGLSQGRLLVAANRWVDGFDDEDESFIVKHFNGTAQFVGSSVDDQAISNQILSGFIPTDSPSMSPMIRESLYRITGQQEFAPVTPTKRDLRRARRKDRRRR